MITRE